MKARGRQRFRLFITVLVAVVLPWSSTGYASGEPAASIPEARGYACNAPQYDQRSNYTAPEGGPPVASVQVSAFAVQRWGGVRTVGREDESSSRQPTIHHGSDCTFARPSVHVYSTYDHPRLLVRFDTDGTATGGEVQGTHRDLSAPQASQTAAKTGSHVLPIGPGSEKAWTVLNRIDAKGAPLPGFKGGSSFKNSQGRLPEPRSTDEVSAGRSVQF